MTGRGEDPECIPEDPERVTGDERLRAIKEREARATKGPWRLGHHRGFGEEHDVDRPEGRALSGERGMFYRKADAEFAARAREDVPWLVEALEGALAELRGPRRGGRRYRSAEPLSDEEATALALDLTRRAREETRREREADGDDEDVLPALTPEKIRERREELRKKRQVAHVSRKADLPDEVVAVLGDDPEREALEALLLHLIRTDRVSVAWAGEKLELDRWESIRWYVSHGYPYPDYSEEDLEEDLRHAEGFAIREREADGERIGSPGDRQADRREGAGVTRPRFCPACGAVLIGENTAVGLLDERSGDVGYDCSCRTCGWSGDVYPDDEQGE